MAKKRNRKAVKKKTKKAPNQRHEQKGGSNMGFATITAVTTIVSVVILLTTLFSQHYFSQRDYEYQRDPVFSPKLTTEVSMQRINTDSGVISIPAIKSINIEIESENNLENIYMVSPDYKIQELPGNDYEAELTEYFTTEFKEYNPDIITEDYVYSYRFLVFSSLDDEMEVNLFYFKTQVVKDGDVAEFTFNKADKATILQLEKAHPNNPAYEGEKMMAKQFKEIWSYYQDFI